MSDPGKELQNGWNSVGSTLEGAAKTLNQTLDNMARNPLIAIETVALTVALGPAGFELATLANASIIASAAVAAANGGNIQNIALSAAAAYAGGQIGNYIGSAVGESGIGTSIDYGTNIGSQQTAMLAAQEAVTSSSGQFLGSLQGTTSNVLQQIAGSASGAAAAAAISGKPLDQVLIAGAAGAVAGTVSSQLASLKNSDGSPMFSKNDLKNC